MSQSFGITVDLDGALAALDGMQERTREAARPAAQAAAQVLYDAVKTNVAGIGRVTGNLASSIYQAYSRDNSSPGRATYHVSWNAKRAPHGHLVEFGHMLRYEYYRDEQGRVRPKVRPEKQGMPRPSRRASQTVKDAYYVPRAGGPVQVAARPFVRPAMAQFDRAMEAAKAVLLARIAGDGA